MLIISTPVGSIPITGLVSLPIYCPQVNNRTVRLGLPDVATTFIPHIFDGKENSWMTYGPAVTCNNFTERSVKHSHVDGSIIDWSAIPSSGVTVTPYDTDVKLSVYFTDDGTPFVPVWELNKPFVIKTTGKNRYGDTILTQVRVRVGTVTSLHVELFTAEYSHNVNSNYDSGLFWVYTYRAITSTKTGVTSWKFANSPASLLGSPGYAPVNDRVRSFTTSCGTSIDEQYSIPHATPIRLKYALVDLLSANDKALFAQGTCSIVPAKRGSIMCRATGYSHDAVLQRCAPWFSTWKRKSELRLDIAVPWHDNMELLANQALSRATYVNTNIAAYVRDLPRSFSEVAVARQLGRNFNLKNAASLHLSTTYGTRLTLSDTIQAISGMKKYLDDQAWESKVRYVNARAEFTSVNEAMSVDNVNVKIAYKLAYNPIAGSGISTIRNLCEDLGIWLDWKNVWDLIPYSFVADWCVNIEDLCSAADNQKYLVSCKISAEVVSCKCQYVLALPPCTTGNLSYTAYFRQASPVSTVTPREDYTSSSLSGANVVTGASLLIQRIHT